MTETSEQLRVFLCHASADKPVVRVLSERISTEKWIDVWIDENKLLPGQDWRINILDAVETSDIVIICLSNNSVNKEGYVQKELRYAQEIALEKPEDTIFLIPLRLEECSVPRGLRFYQWVDYFDEKQEQGYKNLIASLRLKYNHKKEKAEREAAEKAARLKTEKAEREAAEKAAREKAEKETAEKAARLKAEEEERQRIVREKAEREAAEKAAREKAEKEVAEKVARLKADEEELQRNAREKAEREVAEKAAREKAEKEVAEKVALLKAEEEEQQRIVREKAEREVAAREKAEKEAAEMATQLKVKEEERQQIARDKTERDATEKVTQDKVIELQRPKAKASNPLNTKTQSKLNNRVIVASLGLVSMICIVAIAIPVTSFINGAVQNIETQLTESAFLTTEYDNAVHTETVGTASAQLTQAASIATKPPTIIVVTKTSIPSATAICDQALFIRDVTISDDTTFTPGETFTKTWRFKNAGTCTWSGYSLVFDSGDGMNAISPIAFETVGPGQEVDLSVTLKAPSTPGTYRGYWRIRSSAGFLIPVLGGTQDKSFFVQIVVAKP